MQVQTLEETFFNFLIFGKSRFPPKKNLYHQFQVSFDVLTTLQWRFRTSTTFFSRHSKEQFQRRASVAASNQFLYCRQQDWETGLPVTQKFELQLIFSSVEAMIRNDNVMFYSGITHYNNNALTLFIFSSYEAQSPIL